MPATVEGAGKWMIRLANFYYICLKIHIGGHRCIDAGVSSLHLIRKRLPVVFRCDAHLVIHRDLKGVRDLIVFVSLWKGHGHVGRLAVASASKYKFLKAGIVLYNTSIATHHTNTSVVKGWVIVVRTIHGIGYVQRFPCLYGLGSIGGGKTEVVAHHI